MLINQTIQKANATGLPVIVIDSENQKGDNFGQKLSNAFGEVFSRGYENVIAIGTDCPRLNAGTILSAYNQLQRSPLIIGPDLRGGTYLIALNKKAFIQHLFEKLAWQSYQLCDNIKNYASDIAVNITVLQRLGDFHQHVSINNATRLVALLNDSCFRFICRLLTMLKETILSSFIHLFVPPVSSASLKAPPALSLSK